MKPKKAVGIVFKGPNEPTRWELIMADLEAGKPYGEVAKAYKTSVGTIRVYDRVRQGQTAKPEKKAVAPADMSVAELYMSGYGIEAIARGRGVTNDEVSWALELAGISKRGTRHLHIPTEQEIDEIEAAWKRGESSNSLAKRFNVSIFRIKRYMEIRGAERPWSEKTITEAEWAQAARDYVAGATYKEIAARLHRSQATISQKFAAMGVQVRPRAERSRIVAKATWAKRRAQKHEQGTAARNDEKPDQQEREPDGAV